MPVHRFEVTAKAGLPDPLGDSVARDAAAIGLPTAGVRTRHVYLLQADLTAQQSGAIAERLLADPVTEEARAGAAAPAPGAQVVEVHPLPGVMDAVAQSVREAVRGLVGVDAQVVTAWRYDVAGVTSAQAALLAQRLLANPVIHRVVYAPLMPAAFPEPRAHEQSVREVPLTSLDDDALARLSREAHLFLSLDEMRAIQAHYRALGREPRDIELETLAQTWSEHCVHKTLKSTVRYTAAAAPADPINWRGRPGHDVQPDGSVVIHNLLKSTIAAATHELIADGVNWTLSVFSDNSGVVAFDEHFAVCIKVETHNHPSAIEPYGGAATGIGGCIRDVIGTGLGARPIASTDVFCVADAARFAPAPAPAGLLPLPPGTLHPRRVLSQVVAGVRDYGNRMGIPTVSGAVAFDDRYVANPLVFCGCIGLIPRGLVRGRVRRGDRIIALGGRTGRDGIHGATFSSAELEHTTADEFAHAVQIGNPIEEKRVLEAILRARDAGDPPAPLFHALTDCGAGGFSSAIGEMGREVGAEVHLERAPLKYPGLSYTEVWISEAQERMVLAVPPESLARLRSICEQEQVELADLGHFGTPASDLVLNFHAREVGRLPMDFLHEGLPMPTREAHWAPARRGAPVPVAPPPIKDALLALLAHPNIASKHWIIRQYDHEVRGASVVKPLVGLGAGGRAAGGPADASVIEPVPGSGRAIAVACGLQTPLGDPALAGDPYLMALAAIDECVRNLVCVGADPARTAILDNFCWPSCALPANMGALVRACAGCYDGAKAYRTPFVSGKDSLNNQFKYVDPATGQPRVIEVPPTLLITGLGIVPDVGACVTSDAKRPGDVLLLIGPTHRAMGGALVNLLDPALLGQRAHLGDSDMPRVDLALGPAAARLVADLIARGVVRAAHDCAEGGLLVAVAEMLIGGCGPGAALGARLDLTRVDEALFLVAAFSEAPSRYVLEVAPADVPSILHQAHAARVPAAVIGELDSSGMLTEPAAGLSAVVGDLAYAWGRTLDW